MPLVRVPGVGTVNVPKGSEDEFRNYILANQPEVKLAAQFDRIAREIRSGMIEVTQENRKDLRAIVNEVKKIKQPAPIVNVEPPQVNVEAQAPAVFEPKIEPNFTPQVEVITESKRAKKIKISNIERNGSFRITGCELDVVEWDE